MNLDLIHNIVNLRFLVAYLGEKEQKAWWSSSFLSRSGEAFLSPVFPKTSTMARINGASGAAQVVHDEHIGVGEVFHLFRLPESIEYGISHFLAKNSSDLDVVDSEVAAQAGLQDLAAGGNINGIGPLLVDGGMIDLNMIRRMAAAYMQGFSSGEQVYPYYRSKV